MAPPTNDEVGGETPRELDPGPLFRVPAMIPIKGVVKKNADTGK
jgi:hypothetical protein